MWPAKPNASRKAPERRASLVVEPPRSAYLSCTNQLFAVNGLCPLQRWVRIRASPPQTLFWSWQVR
jgi:hypothetical protein